MEVKEKWYDKQTKYLCLESIQPNGIANFYGLRDDDILCIPGRDGELMCESVKGVKEGWRMRPLTIEVRRGQLLAI
jgi:hypothetical protein